MATGTHIDSGASAGGAGNVLECFNPATGEKLAELPIATTEDVARAAQKARDAFSSWSQRSVAERAAFLLRARDILMDRQDEVLQLLVDEAGKARMEALIVDILILSDTIGYYASNAEKFLADDIVSPHLLKNKRVRVQHAPHGIVANISPWNYPLDLAWSPLVAALIAGNVVINKPSEVTPLISLKFHEILMDAGIPDGVAQVLVGRGDVGAALIDQADFICFTGSVATGRKVAVACAQNLKPCTLELGGKDPALVLEDADVDRAANGVVTGAFFNMGQTCVSIERVYVVEDVYDAFVDKVVYKTEKLRQGIDSGYDVDLGSMTFPRQVEIVEDHVADAVEKGATVRTGGKRNPSFPNGLFYEPTVLTDVTHDMKIMKDETFGPILPIFKVRDAEEALRLANDSEYGLNASIWTRDTNRGRNLARRLESGNVCVNDWAQNYAVVEAPFGGVKHSGIGRRKGPGEIRKYCYQKTILEDIFQARRDPAWYPYSSKLGASAAKGLKMLFRSGIGNKLRGLFGD